MQLQLYGRNYNLLPFLIPPFKRKPTISGETFQNEFLLWWPQTEPQTKSSIWAFPGVKMSLLKIHSKQCKSRLLRPSTALHVSMYGGACLESVIEKFSPILNSAIAGGTLMLWKHHTPLTHGHGCHIISIKTSGSHLSYWGRPPVNRCVSAPMTFRSFSWSLTSCYWWGTLWTLWHHWTQPVLSEQPRSHYHRLMVQVNRAY